MCRLLLLFLLLFNIINFSICSSCLSLWKKALRLFELHTFYRTVKLNYSVYKGRVKPSSFSFFFHFYLCKMPEENQKVFRLSKFLQNIYVIIQLCGAYPCHLFLKHPNDMFKCSGSEVYLCHFNSKLLVLEVFIFSSKITFSFQTHSKKPKLG